MHSKDKDNQNLFLAIFLSIIVILAWNYFYAAPKLQEKHVANQQSASTTLPSSAINAGQHEPSSIPINLVVPRETALEQAPRIKIETPSLNGSLSLQGGRIDDLRLANYHETVDNNSPTIILFSPLGGVDAYFADMGWLASAGGGLQLPTSETLWKTQDKLLSPSNPVTLTYDNGQGLVFTRKIEIDNKYMFTIVEKVKNDSNSVIKLANYSRISHFGTPKLEGFSVLHEGALGFLQDKLQELKFEDVRKAKIKTFTDSKGGWLGMTEKYWASAIVPDQNSIFSGAFSANGSDPVYEATAIQEVKSASPGEEIKAKTYIFAGAKEVNTIKEYTNTFSITNFDLMIDWGWFYFFTKPLFNIIDWIYKLVGNFGIAILIVTVLLKLLFYPLANKSYASMAKMKNVTPQLNAIKERLNEDKMAQQQAIMELYRKEKINPMAGCLPVIIQIPVFFALYKVLFVTIEMRHAPFYGWIKDLAAPDPTNIFNLFGLLPYDPGTFLHLGVWPILMGVTMWLQMKMNPEPTDPLQKTMFSWMPFIFTFMLGSFPAGLVIYWAWSNFLSILQQYTIMKKMGTKIELWGNLKNTFVKKPSKST